MGGGGDYCASHVNVQDATHITTTNIHIQSQGFGDNPSQQVVVLRNTKKTDEEDRGRRWKKTEGEDGRRQREKMEEDRGRRWKKTEGEDGRRQREKMEEDRGRRWQKTDWRRWKKTEGEDGVRRERKRKEDSESTKMSKCSLCKINECMETIKHSLCYRARVCV